MRRRLLTTLAAAVILLGSLPAAQAASAAEWQPTARLTNDAGESRRPDVAVADGVVHVVWQGRSSDLSDSRLFYRRSLDGGASWEPRLVLSKDDSGRPVVEVSGNNVHVAWIGNDAKSSVIKYRKSQDGGETWGPRQRVSAGRGNRDIVNIAVWREAVHIVWGDTVKGNWNIYYRRSLDGGDTWSNRKQLSDTDNGSHSPVVAAWGSNVHVIWWENPGYFEYRRSGDGGKSFAPLTTVGTGSWSQAEADIDASKSTVVMTWLGWDDGYRIFYRHSEDGGATWSDARAVSNRVNGSPDPSVAVSARRFHIVWPESIDGQVDLLYRTSATGGEIWGKVFRLTDNKRASVSFGIDAQRERAHVVWVEEVRGDGEVFYKRRV